MEFYLTKKKLNGLKKNGIYISKTVTIDKNVRIYKNNYILGEGYIGKNSIIYPNNFIENAEIGYNCLIGPSARIRGITKIGNECKIGNFVEIKNSIISEKSKISHLTYIGDSIIGEKCNFGCGVVVCNYDGKNKHKTIIGNNCFIGSNVNLIAPITLGNDVFIAAGSTINKDIESGGRAIARVRQEKLNDKKDK